MSAGARFNPAQRVLHWAMAAMVLAMLFIGIGMVTTLAPRYHTLVALHRPLGITTLVLALVRLGLRAVYGAPPLPADLPAWQRAGAKASHLVLYALIFTLPLVGWAMLSAGGYPIVLLGPIHLPAILPHDDALYGLFRIAHTWLAYLLFATFLAHLAAALVHGLIRRDGVFTSMAPRFGITPPDASPSKTR